MIRFDDVGVTYAGRDAAVLRDVSFEIGAGEFVLVTGRTGSGKSTLLRAINGLVPHATGGTLSGAVSVLDRSTADHPPREFAHLVGSVGQDPLAAFVTDTVEEELAYGMEQLGTDPQVMRRRVEELLDLLGIVELRGRALRALSGGQQQRVAIGAALGPHPPVLVLDEPTSALDPTAAEEVLATLARLVHDLDVTIVLAEHRLERVLPFVDRVLLVEGDGSVTDGAPAAKVQRLEHAPPIVELGRLAGWDPIPLTVRDARAAHRTTPVPVDDGDAGAATAPNAAAPVSEVVLDADGIEVRFGSRVAVRGVDLTFHRGDVLAVMGRNGAGKSSLLWALRDPATMTAGSVTTDARIALVPQTASDLLVADRVERECADADARAGAPAGSCAALLARLAPYVRPDAHPRDLSAGGQLALALAMQLVGGADVVLLDEPTRGLDYAGKAQLADIVADLAHAGSAIAIATHDVEFAAQVASRAIVLADGEVVSDGAAAEVLAASPAFAPQVTKVLGGAWRTVAQVREALEARSPVEVGS